MNDQHEDIGDNTREYDITEDGKLVATDEADAEFEDLTFDG